MIHLKMIWNGLCVIGVTAIFIGAGIWVVGFAIENSTFAIELTVKTVLGFAYAIGVLLNGEIQ